MLPGVLKGEDGGLLISVKAKI